MAEQATIAAQPSTDVQPATGTEVQLATEIQPDNLIGAENRPFSWKKTKDQMEKDLRPMALRWGKPTEEMIDKLVKKHLGHYFESGDREYTRAILKCKSNVATWKNRTLINIEEFIKSKITSDKTGLLRATTDPKALFTAFESTYSFHDAETVFSYAAKYVKFFIEPKWPNRGQVKKGPYWIQTYFINLCVKTKQWLDNIEAPRKEGTQRSDLLDYYDRFPYNNNFTNIRLDHMIIKSNQSRRYNPKKNKPVAEAFGMIEVDIESSGDEFGAISEEDENE